jgi:hypothetical protein
MRSLADRKDNYGENNKGESDPHDEQSSEEFAIESQVHEPKCDKDKLHDHHDDQDTDEQRRQLADVDHRNFGTGHDSEDHGYLDVLEISWVITVSVVAHGIR